MRCWWAFGSKELNKHRDPFDRMLAAQSLLEDVPVASDG